MKILFLRPRAEPGGATRQMIVMARALSERDHDVVLGTSSGSWSNQFPRFVRFALFPSTPVNLITAAVQISRFVVRERVAVMHSHHRFSTLVGRLVSSLTGVPLVSFVHEFKTNWRFLASLWTAPWLCVPTEALRAHLVQHFGIMPWRISIIRPGSDWAPSPESTLRDFRQAEGLSDGAIVGFVGRLSPEKGVMVLIDALPSARASHPNAQFVIVGDGPQRQEAEAQAGQFDLGASLRFLGHRDDAPLWISLCDLIVAPSFTENFSQTVLEAMTAGRPVVASAVGGLPEMIQDGVTGRLVPPNDPVALADAISGLLANPQAMQRMGEAGRRRASEWSPDRAAEALEQIYLRALGRSA